MRFGWKFQKESGHYLTNSVECESPAEAGADAASAIKMDLCGRDVRSRGEITGFKLEEVLSPIGNTHYHGVVTSDSGLHKVYLTWNDAEESGRTDDWYQEFFRVLQKHLEAN